MEHDLHEVDDSRDSIKSIGGLRFVDRAQWFVRTGRSEIVEFSIFAYIKKS